MDAHKSSVSGVLKNEVSLAIPYYQRNYEWHKCNRERFIKDMSSLGKDDFNYFFGPIILKDFTISNDERKQGINEKYLVVDGQQRLTTMMIFLKALHLRAGKNEMFSRDYFNEIAGIPSPILRHGFADRNAFREVMFKDVLSEIQWNEPSEIINAYNEFREYVMSLSEKECDEIIKLIKGCVNFAVITLGDEDSEQAIFDSINSLGLPLTTDELIKNFLYGPEDEDIYSKTWKEEFDTGINRKFWKESQGSEKVKANLVTEKFFYNYVRIKMWEYKDMFIANDRTKFVKENETFETCKAFCNRFGEDKLALANDIVEYAKLYREYLSNDILDKPITAGGSISRISCLINSGQNVLVPYVLYVLKNQKDVVERNRIFSLVETYIVRRMLVSKDTKRYSEMFAETLIDPKYLTFDGLNAYLLKRDPDSAVAYPSDSVVCHKINEIDMDEKKANLLHYLLWSKVCTDRSALEGCNDYNAEAIMPKPKLSNIANWPKHSDPAEEDRRVRLLKTFGNYVLVPSAYKKKVTALHDEPLIKKLTGLAPLCKGLTYTTQTIEQSQKTHTWDEDYIQARNEFMAKQFIKYWPM